MEDRQMYNWNAMESEAAYRRLEWDRAVAADARAGLARPKRPGTKPASRSHLSLWDFNVKQLVASGVSWLASITTCRTMTSPCPTVQSRPNGAS